MLKKSLLSLAILGLGASFTVAHAGPYLGVDIGINTNTAKYTNYRGAQAKFDLGYSSTQGSGYYFAGEIFGVPGSVSIDNYGLKSTYSYGLSFIPGALFSDHVLGFARIGVLRTHFQPSGTGSKNLSGGQFGLGLQTSLTQSWDLRGEYDFVAYKSLDGLGSPRADQFNLGLVYKFD